VAYDDQCTWIYAIMMSQYDFILMLGEVCWHSVHIILHALSLLVIVACNVSL